jgi:iron-sulfur cluster repair protein YtfE (RIC family)
MNPSEVRTQILAEHDRLRVLLSELEAAADRDALRRALGELLSSLRNHVAREDEILVPALEAADAWGPQRAARIRENHEAQLRLLSTWERAATGSLAPADLASRLAHFAAGLRDDMASEEADLLRPDVLRDDVVAISQASS